jgi:hypothetical protein
LYAQISLESSGTRNCPIKEEAMRLTIKLISLGAVLSLLLAACNMPKATPDAAATIQAVYTSQAQMAGTLQVPTATLGNPPTIVFPTLQPATVMPTQTQSAPTALPPAPRTTYCDWAAYVKDVTVPDGTIFAPGTQFTKTWRLQNIGTCSWTPSYALVYTSGAQMSGPAIAALTGNVNPGQTVDVSVNLTAPSSEGTYQGYWMLRNASGTYFGLGGTAKNAFYVDIKVVGGMTNLFDFASRYCEADWVSGAGDLHCGYTNEKKGYGMLVDKPQMEDGRKYNGLGVLMVPENVTNGYIKGIYPAFLVQKGDRFRAYINCEYQSNGCNVVFRLDYQIGNNQPQTIWQFTEAYEGQYYTVDTDLSPLAGHQVRFILTVLANGSPANDRALWVAPRIERPSNLITPSVTPSITPTVTVTSTGVPPTFTSTPTVTVTSTSVPNTATPTATSTTAPTSTPTVTVTP